MQSFKKLISLHTLRISRQNKIINHNQLRYFLTYQPVLIKKLHSLRLPESNSPQLFSTQAINSDEVDPLLYEKVCEETLESLSDYFEQLVEESSNLDTADVSYSSGVLTINLGENYGTYVINRQSPNKQIWLSSPTSGPKRYDYVMDGNYWVYKHDGKTLHQLLQEEISKIVNHVDFSKCVCAKL